MDLRWAVRALEATSGGGVQDSMPQEVVGLPKLALHGLVQTQCHDQHLIDQLVIAFGILWTRGLRRKCNKGFGPTSVT